MIDLVDRLLERLLPVDEEFARATNTVHQVSLSCNPLPPPKLGGIESTITNLTRGLLTRDVDVVCYAPSPFDIDGAGHYETLPEPSTGPTVEDDPPNTRAHLAAIVEGLDRNWEPGDVIHFHSHEHYPYVGKYLRLRNPTTPFNYVETAHWDGVGMGRNIVYPSQALKQSIGSPGTVVPHGIDLSVFHPPATPPDVSDYVLYTGRIMPEKGLHHVLDAASDRELEFRVAGPIVDEEYFRDLEPEITYLGELPQAELVEHYQGARAFVYMTDFVEAYGLSVVEAMACGTPVVTSGKGGTSETVIDGETGYICEPDRVGDALDRIDQIDRRDCVERAQDFGIDAMTEGYLEYYEAQYA